MELKLKSYKIPDKVEFNYAELKEEIENKLEYYNNLVYAESEIKEAKADKAKLNKLKKALNDERIKQEKLYLAPFNDFKRNINEIIDILDKPIKKIDIQIKEYDSKQKALKRNKIKEIFDKNNSIEWLSFDKIFNLKWLNTSVSIKKAESEIADIIANIKYDLEVIKDLDNADEVLVFYKQLLNLNEAIQKGSRYVKEKNLLQNNSDPESKERIEEPKDDKQMAWIGFKAYLSIETALELKAFFNSKNIKFQPIEVMEELKCNK